MDDDKHPHPVDITVGSRVRRARLSRGLSQGALAERIGVTFQQVQKYENGSNRISASKLVEIADHLGVPASSFLEGIGLHASRTVEGEAEHPSGAAALLTMYAELPPPMRETVLQLVVSLRDSLDRSVTAKRASRKSGAEAPADEASAGAPRHEHASR